MLVGINLLREGLDLPGIIVAILDADKEGFLRSGGALIGRWGAPRARFGRAVLYADAMTDSMRHAIGETERQRRVQEAFNVERHHTRVDREEHRRAVAYAARLRDGAESARRARSVPQKPSWPHSWASSSATCARLRRIDFERAAALRDRLKRLRNPISSRPPASVVAVGGCRTLKRAAEGVQNLPAGPGGARTHHASDLRTT